MEKPRLRCSIFAMSLSLCCLGAAHAQQASPPTPTYKVISADGRVSYVDEAGIPKGARATRVSGHTPDGLDAGIEAGRSKYSPPTDPASVPRQPTTAHATTAPGTGPRVDAGAAPESAVEDAKDDARTQMVKRECDLARQNLGALNHGRVARYAADGQRQFLSDAELAVEKARTARQIQENCTESAR